MLPVIYILHTTHHAFLNYKKHRKKNSSSFHFLGIQVQRSSSMATAPAKSPLHNFPLSFLKWGSTSSINPHHRCRRSVDSSPPPPPSDKSIVPVPESEHHEQEPEEQSQRQWNLRPRRSSAAEIGGFGHQKIIGEFLTESETATKSTRLRGMADGGLHERREKRKFWIALSKDEIEEDIYSLTGSKPSRRPRKRPRNIQKQLDSFFPGLWLVGISPEAYRSLDAPTKKSNH